ncbi:hypothetical protein [Aggregatibacter aphrophilus]|uniref:hypothetical protein n=1 Tax=Aggregatibacter aphrophilus TaxID=732 RepID=UPI00022FF019|nr:hypothetical protein [Aggregatibacter aphrophilus]EHB88912.1 hypothetical protein HMPREF9335_02097 [Aggregatibacter aphrophilus F0387]
MRYYGTKQKIKLGDIVKLSNNNGVVVAIIDDDLYSENYTKKDWEYLEKGLLVNFDEYGLIHYIEPEEDLMFVCHQDN